MGKHSPLKRSTPRLRGHSPLCPAIQDIRGVALVACAAQCAPREYPWCLGLCHFRSALSQFRSALYACQSNRFLIKNTDWADIIGTCRAACCNEQREQCQGQSSCSSCSSSSIRHGSCRRAPPQPLCGPQLLSVHCLPSDAGGPVHTRASTCKRVRADALCPAHFHSTQPCKLAQSATLHALVQACQPACARSSLPACMRSFKPASLHGVRRPAEFKEAEGPTSGQAGLVTHMHACPARRAHAQAPPRPIIKPKQARWPTRPLHMGASRPRPSEARVVGA